MRAIYIRHMYSEKEMTLGLSRLGVRFLDGSNSWNVNGTPNVRIVRQMIKSTEPAGLCQSSCTT